MRDDGYLLIKRRSLNVLANFPYLEAMQMEKVDLYMTQVLLEWRSSGDNDGARVLAHCAG